MFLVSFKPPHEAVIPTTIVRWVVNVLRKAGTNVNYFGAHLTRSASSSKVSKTVLSNQKQIADLMLKYLKHIAENFA